MIQQQWHLKVTVKRLTGNTVFTPNFLFKEKHHKKLWAYQMEREGGTSASIWSDDEELKCLLKGGGELSLIV